MTSIALTLRLRPNRWTEVDGKRCKDSTFDVLGPDGQSMPQFFLMAGALENDIESAAGSGAKFLEGLKQVESGEIEEIHADGMAWIQHISRDKVWFEGAYSQGEGGTVSFAQYKFAVQTYVRFLADPERKPIEVAFPED